jgi:hypothetical protein
MDKDQFLKLMRMSPEEIEGYGSGSTLMDDYIKENDPEQWEKIRNARSVQDAINLGLGTAGAMKLPGKGLMGKFGPVRKSINEAKGELPKDIYNKAIGHLNPETPNFGKVTTAELPEQALGKVIQKTTPEQGLGKVTQVDIPEQAAGSVKNIPNEETLSLMEQLKKIEHTLNTDPRFLRLNELLKEKKAKKGE